MDGKLNHLTQPGAAPAGKGAKSAVPNSIEPRTSIRDDSLTGLPNLLGLFDWLEPRKDPDPATGCSLMAIHLTALWKVNRARGRTAGDEFLKWYTKVLQDHCAGPVFRTGGDKFVVLLIGADPAQNFNQAQSIAGAIDLHKMDLPYQSTRIAVIHFSAPEELKPGNVLACLSVALSDRYQAENEGTPQEFYASDIQAMSDYPWMVVDLADQMIRLGNTADESLRLSQTDSISQLPNMRAALSELETAITRARQEQEPLSVLMIDGDNLRQYNQVSYEAGDEAIRLLGSTLRQQLREIDFLARWRVGDEFLILLPETTGDSAIQAGERLCRAVKMAGKQWLFPTTISIGVAAYPEDGDTMQDLIHKAEQGLESAKANGKNQVIHFNQPHSDRSFVSIH